MTKTIAFCTYVSDEYYHSFGADKLIASAKYFYPEIPFFIYGTEEIKKIGLPVESLHPFMMNKLKSQFDIVVYLDADSIITGTLNELFTALEEYEVVCVRNNNDYGKAGCEGAISQQNRDINIYVNAGLVATTSQDFISDWMHNNRLFAELVPFGSQSVLNTIIDKYHWAIVDPMGAGVYYGVSSLSGVETHWESWKDISLIESKYLMLSGNCIKVLHHAGGFKPDKLGLYLFNDEVRKRLIEIIYPPCTD